MTNLSPQQAIACTLKVNQSTVIMAIAEYKKVILLLNIRLVKEGNELRIVAMSAITTE